MVKDGEGDSRGRFKREGTYVYLWLIHVDVWQKPTKFCKSVILQLKIKKNFLNTRQTKLCQLAILTANYSDSKEKEFSMQPK